MNFIERFYRTLNSGPYTYAAFFTVEHNGQAYEVSDADISCAFDYATIEEQHTIARLAHQIEQSTQSMNDLAAGLVAAGIITPWREAHAA